MTHLEDETIGFSRQRSTQIIPLHQSLKHGVQVKHTLDDTTETKEEMEAELKTVHVSESTVADQLQSLANSCFAKLHNQSLLHEE